MRCLLFGGGCAAGVESAPGSEDDNIGLIMPWFMGGSAGTAMSGNTATEGPPGRTHTSTSRADHNLVHTPACQMPWLPQPRTEPDYGSMEKRSMHVCIVGAGIVGLRHCLYALQRAGYYCPCPGRRPSGASGGNGAQLSYSCDATAGHDPGIWKMLPRSCCWKRTLRWPCACAPTANGPGDCAFWAPATCAPPWPGTQARC